MTDTMGFKALLPHGAPKIQRTARPSYIGARNEGHQMGGASLMVNYCVVFLYAVVKDGECESSSLALQQSGW